MSYLRLKGACGLFACLGIGLFFVLLPADSEAQVSDTTPPSLVEFSFTPNTVDVSTGEQTITVTLRILDDLLGFTTGTIFFQSPSGQHNVTAVVANRISGDALDGIYQTLMIVPQFIENGVYHFLKIELYDPLNGGQLDEQDFIAMGFPTTFTVISAIEVEIDIKPGSCPNPLNTKSKGVLPVAILGTEEFDVTQINPATIQLEGVSPLRWNLEDVATPFDGEPCECHELGGDGWFDLTLKFRTQDIVAMLGDVNDGDEVVLTLTGELYGGTPIEGQDCVWILKKGKEKGKKKGK